MAEQPLDPVNPLAGFGEPTRAWFEGAFAQPTPAQAGAWASIGAGQHTLLIAPTGSGKTLAAFLQSLDRLMSEPVDQPSPDRPTRGRPSRENKVRVVYISPLKALAVDVDRNLRAPLRGITATAERLGRRVPDVKVAVRSGDTPAQERRRLQTHPPDILITTPESLFLMLSSQVASTLDQVEVVIVDEIHALAGTKRGVHLMVSLERLAAMSNKDPQRIGLSATVRPPDRVAAFLGGDRPVTIVAPPSTKQWQLSVEVPVPDMSELPALPDDAGSSAPGSMWAFLERRLLDLIEAHRTTLCFVNSRRVAERLTAHLNELAAARASPGDALTHQPHAPPAQVMAQSGSTTGVDESRAPIVARAHHGSVSKERRAEIESELLAGALPCVVATSSLELGIDVGVVDQVIQVSAPPSVASGLQRVGRAGHQVGAISRGVVLPTHRSDLVEAGVVLERMVTGEIEAVGELVNPLDVLAQQLVSMCLAAPTPTSQLHSIVTRVQAYRDLPDSAWNGVLEMLTGRYPSEDFQELRPRLVWDRAADVVSARPGSRQLVTTSGGTIPDRGLFGVFLATGTGPGRRVGELDEEMVYESRIGDVFTLGTTSWRIEEITPHQVLVSPAPGAPGRLPFWRGESQGRPAELGGAIGRALDRWSQPDTDQVRASLRAAGLDEYAADNLIDYLADQQAATGVVPSHTTIVVERFVDELGDWRICIHSPWGQRVHAPWALAIERQARQRYGVDVHANAADDGIVIRLPMLDGPAPGADLVDIAGDDLETMITEEVFGSALFASRFRECAARALLLPRRQPGRRAPLWQQRMRSAQLLQVASAHADFPIVLETMRECLRDVFDLDSLSALVADIAARRTRVVEVQTEQASPFARSLLFGYVGEFLYDGDQPLAERRMAALSVDPSLLAELLGREGTELLLDPAALDSVGADLQRTSEPTRATNLEQAWDVVRTVGPLSLAECAARGIEPDWIEALELQRRVARVRLAGEQRIAADADLGILRDALGVPVPAGYGDEPPVRFPEALQRLVLRLVRTHTGMTAAAIADRLAAPEEAVVDSLKALADSEGVLCVEGPDSGTEHGDRWWHPRVLAMVKRRTIALLRSDVEPVEPQQYARFLTHWHELGQQSSGVDVLSSAIDQIAGVPVPASMLESLVLPARVANYLPAQLDELIAAGQVVWTGHEPLALSDGWITLWPSDLVLTTPPSLQIPPDLSPEQGERVAVMHERLSSGGAWTLSELVPDQRPGPDDEAELWRLVWSGHLTSDSMAAIRGLGGGTLKRPRAPQPRRRGLARPTRIAVPSGPPGRWSLVRPTVTDPTERGLVMAEVLLNRHGVITRGAVANETIVGSFTEAYRVLTVMEETGAARRGYIVEGLGAAQFAAPGAVDRVREAGPSPALLLAASDPANPYGAALSWPASLGHRPARKAGALVVIDDGAPTVFVERGIKTLVTFEHTDADQRATAVGLLADAVRSGRLATVTIERVDGGEALGSPEWTQVLTQAGFAMTPRGFKIRSR